MKSKQHRSACVICHQPSTRLVDGEPSCEKHANLVYENQLEDYTKEHLSQDECQDAVEEVSAQQP